MPLNPHAIPMMPSRHLTFPFALAVLTAALAPAQQQQQSNNSEARAEARAEAKNGESRSSTHRVVVVNGKKIVDEKTNDSKPVGGSAGPLPGVGSPDDMLRDLQEQVRKQMEDLQRGQPLPMPTPQARPTPAPAPQARPTPPPAPTPKPAPADGSSGKLRPRRHA